MGVFMGKKIYLSFAVRLNGSLLAPVVIFSNRDGASKKNASETFCVICPVRGKIPRAFKVAPTSTTLCIVEKRDIIFICY